MGGVVLVSATIASVWPAGVCPAGGASPVGSAGADARGRTPPEKRTCLEYLAIHALRENCAGGFSWPVCARNPGCSWEPMRRKREQSQISSPKRRANLILHASQRI